MAFRPEKSRIVLTIPLRITARGRNRKWKITRIGARRTAKVSARRRKNSNEVLIIALGFLFVTTGLAIVFHLSPLLTNMAAGAAIVNLSPQNHRIFRNLEPFTPPIYALFFVIAGTELRPEILVQSEILILGLIYIVARAIGKYGGVYAGCAISKVQPEFKKPIATEVEKLGAFYPAEDYHQDYYEKNPDAPYCSAVISPKVKKVKDML